MMRHLHLWFLALAFALWSAALVVHHARKPKVEIVTCATPWVPAVYGDGKVAGMVCYVNGKPARLVVFR